MTNRLIRPGLTTLLLLSLAACASHGPVPETKPVVRAPAAPLPTDKMPGSSFPADGAWQCVPYARAVSGIELYGDAWTWWDQAAGKFARGQSPKRGAVLVFAKGPKLRLGHLAVVIDINGTREIGTTDANWGGSQATRGFIHDDQLISDVSADNSWRQVRVWNKKAKAWGSVYDTYGFIYPPREWGPPRCALPDGSVGICPSS